MFNYNAGHGYCHCGDCWMCNPGKYACVLRGWRSDFVCFDEKYKKRLCSQCTMALDELDEEEKR